MHEERFRIAIIGAGFGGLATAVNLLRRGIEDFVVVERADDVGGVWEANTYPGCRCDVPSHLYSLSFAPNPDWSHTYSAQGEIRDYLRRVADEHGVRPHLRTGVRVLTASWDEGSSTWKVETSAGTIEATVLVNATGPLTEPMIPDIPGLDGFTGEVMHSARWNHDFDLVGKRVASIGTGASAIQYVPAIADEVAHLDVYQRTAPWVMPHNDRPITAWERRLFRRVPVAQRLMREAIYWARELMVVGFTRRPGLMRFLERGGRANIERGIDDPVLRERVTPGYAVGCKRIVPSNRWYRTLARDDVELVTSPIAEVRERSVVDAEGNEREVDAIVLGTGFHVTDMPFAELVTGPGGVRLSDHWDGSPRAYLGTAVPGFPNLFLLLGPNTGSGHTSMVFMIEAQVEHLLSALTAMEARGAETVEVRAEVHDAYNREVDRRMAATVWNTGGCSSFYFDENGRNATLWPDFTWRFRRRATAPVESAYAFGAPAPHAAAATEAVAA